MAFLLDGSQGRDDGSVTVFYSGSAPSDPNCSSKSDHVLQLIRVRAPRRAPGDCREIIWLGTLE